MKLVIGLDNKIKVSFFGFSGFVDLSNGESLIDVPDNFSGVAGDDIRMWDSLFNLRPASEIVAEGLRELLPTEKIVDEVIVKKTLQELVDDGIEALSEDQVIIGNGIFLKSKLNDYKEEVLSRISMSFNSALENGRFLSAAIGIVVDCRRSANRNDLQNVEGLIELMVSDGLTETEYVGYSETTTASLEQIRSLKIEMIRFAAQLYYKKWGYEAEIANVTADNMLPLLGDERIRWID